MNKSDVIGTWKLNDGYAIGEDHVKIDYKMTKMVAIKVITEKYFSFIAKKGDEFYASGFGEYIVENNHYTEILKMASWTNEKDITVQFECVLEDNLWKNIKRNNHQIIEYEEWLRLEE